MRATTLVSSSEVACFSLLPLPFFVLLVVDIRSGLLMTMMMSLCALRVGHAPFIDYAIHQVRASE